MPISTVSKWRWPAHPARRLQWCTLAGHVVLAKVARAHLGPWALEIGGATRGLCRGSSRVYLDEQNPGCRRPRSQSRREARRRLAVWARRPATLSICAATNERSMVAIDGERAGWETRPAPGPRMRGLSASRKHLAWVGRVRLWHLTRARVKCHRRMAHAKRCMSNKGGRQTNCWWCAHPASQRTRMTTASQPL